MTLLDIVDVSLWSRHRSLSLKSSSSCDDGAAATNVTGGTSAGPSMLPLIGSPPDGMRGLTRPWSSAASMEAARGCWQWLNAQHRRSLIILPGRWHPESRRRGDLTAGSGTRCRCERCRIEATRGSADLEVRGSGSDAAPVRASGEILRAKSDGACADAGDGERNEPGQLVALRPHGRE